MQYIVINKIVYTVFEKNSMITGIQIRNELLCWLLILKGLCS